MKRDVALEIFVYTFLFALAVVFYFSVTGERLRPPVYTLAVIPILWFIALIIGVYRNYTNRDKRLFGIIANGICIFGFIVVFGKSIYG